MAAPGRSAGDRAGAAAIRLAGEAGYRDQRRRFRTAGGRVNSLPLVLTVFVACAVEAVEALTIVLAAGLTREWRSTLQGMAAALVVLAAAVAVIGPALTLV